MKKRAPAVNLRENRIGLSFSAPAILGLGLFFILPLCISFFYAFKVGGGFGMDNFSRVLASTAFRTALVNTVEQLVLFFALLLVLSMLIALALVWLDRTDPKLVFAFLCIQLLPIAIPSSITGIYIENVFGYYGIINGILSRAGLRTVNFLNSGNAFWVLALIYLWKNTGLAVLMFYARIKALPREIGEAARLDGANGFQRTVYITIPQLGSSLLFVSVISIWGVFKLSRESFILFGNYPDMSVYNLQNFLSNHFQNANYGVISAASTVFFTVISLILLAAVYFGRRKDR